MSEQIKDLELAMDIWDPRKSGKKSFKILRHKIQLLFFNYSHWLLILLNVIYSLAEE